MFQRVEYRLRIDAQANRGENQSTDCYARKTVHGNSVGLGISLPIHGADNLEVVVESAADRDYSDDNERNLTLLEPADGYAARDCGFLALIMFLSSVFYVSRLGFYWDD